MLVKIDISLYNLISNCFSSNDFIVSYNSAVVVTSNGRENIYLQISDITLPSYGYKKTGKRMLFQEINWTITNF